MKAAVINEFKTDPVVQDVPDPEPAEGEAIVDVEFASINGMDVMTWNGGIDGMMPYEFPITMGRDFSGVVSAVADGVTNVAVGDAVFGQVLTMPLHEGTFAEKVRVPAATIAKRPEGLSAQDAGALGLAGGASRSVMAAIELTGGETVLVSGATGGVGSLVIQQAKAAGATVIATALPDEADHVRSLGADEVIDRTGDVAAAVRALRPDGVDVAVHLAGDPSLLATLVASGGRMASTLGFNQDAAGRDDITAEPVRTIPNAEVLDGLAADVVSGALKVPVTTTYPLAEVGKALAEFAQGATGKVSVTIR
jgi:NADPH2:quinone reductase